MKIHPVGYLTILIALIIIVLVNVLLFLLLPLIILLFVILSSVVLSILVFRFFRYPKRACPVVQSNIVLSPADGKIVAIEEVENDKLYDGKAKQISIFMSAHNVHLNWIPIDAKVEKIKYLPGKYLLARNPKSSMLNEMYCVSLKTFNGKQIVVKQIAGIVARRIKSFVNEGQNYSRGEELGFIKFGSRVDVLLPTDSEIHVEIGDKSIGLSTVLATLSE
jgi:phosphatidylserine decarboxylase